MLSSCLYQLPIDHQDVVLLLQPKTLQTFYQLLVSQPHNFHRTVLYHITLRGFEVLPRRRFVEHALVQLTSDARLCCSYTDLLDPTKDDLYDATLRHFI